MRLYHAGPEEVKNPDIKIGRKNSDFGQGFYLTSDRDFAYWWASPGNIVNEYELDTDSLDIKRFERSEEWFSYIYNNRRAKDGITADVVIGPIANDTIFETFGIITSGFLSPKDALSLLMIGPEYTQVVVKSGKAVSQLKWIGSKVITEQDVDAKLIEKTKKEYETSFSEAAGKILQ